MISLQGRCVLDNKSPLHELLKEIGQHVAEKRVHHWALTGFAAEVWGEITVEKRMTGDFTQ